MHVLIIGAGPAGVSAALYARRGGADVTVIAKEVGALGTAETIENYYGIEEPVSGRELARRGIEGARRLGVTFVTDEVLGITGDGTSFAVEGKSELYTGDAVVLATGATRKTLSIPGIREFTGRGVSSCAVCDAFFYRGKTTSVIGAGEYALHEVQVLLPHAAQVQLLTNGGDPPLFRRRLRSIRSALPALREIGVLRALYLRTGRRRIPWAYSLRSVQRGRRSLHVSSECSWKTAKLSSMRRWRRTSPGCMRQATVRAGCCRLSKPLTRERRRDFPPYAVCTRRNKPGFAEIWKRGGWICRRE